jgi:hypothetical protein
MIARSCLSVYKGNSKTKHSPPKVDLLSNAILCKIGSSFDFNFDRKEIGEAVDEFHRDSANLSVLIDAALQAPSTATGRLKPLRLFSTLLIDECSRSVTPGIRNRQAAKAMLRPEVCRAFSRQTEGFHRAIMPTQ